MSLEVVTHIADLNASNPVGGTDPKSQGDDHIRNIKTALKTDLHNITGVVDSTHTQLNYLKSATGTTGTTSSNVVFSASPTITGTLTVATVAATTVTGDGSGLTALNASNLASGTVPNGRFPATLPAASGANLTALTAANVTGSHTLSDGVLSTNVPLLNAANVFTATQTITKASGRWLTLNTSSVSGGYVALNTNGSDIGYFGSADQVFGALPANDVGLLALGNLRLNGNTAVLINGVNVTDFARLSQSNTFLGTGLTLSNAVQPIIVVTDTTNPCSAFMQATDSIAYVGCLTAHEFDIYVNGFTRLAVSSAGNFDFKAGTVTTNNASAAEVGYKGVPENAQSVDYTCVLSDANKSIHNTGTSKTITIPANGSVAYPVGTTLTFINTGSNACSIAITTNDLYLAGTALGTTGTRSLAKGGIATAIKIDATSWLISGVGLS